MEVTRELVVMIVDCLPLEYNDLEALKGQCHEDFAVFGQFRAEILSFRL